MSELDQMALFEMQVLSEAWQDDLPTSVLFHLSVLGFAAWGFVLTWRGGRLRRRR